MVGSGDAPHEETDAPQGEIDRGDIVPQRRELPPRVNRGRLGKQYDEYYVSGLSKYPIADYARGNLTTSAKAYSAAVYSEVLPRNAQEALVQKKWKDAMGVEMLAL